MSPRFIVVVPTAGDCDMLPRTLASLSECDRPSSYDRTIVVENGPKGKALDVVNSARAELNVEYLHVERANKSNALNCVFERFSDDDLIYLIDDDIRFSKNCLLEFAAAAEGQGSGFVFGGPLRIDSDGQPPERWNSFLPGSMKGWEPKLSEFKPASDCFLGANWAVFAGDVRKAGGFDPRFGPGSPMGATGQEWTMQIALRKHGAKFQYLPNAVIWHHVDFSRFSQDFLLRRKYRGGLEAGIRSADFMHHTPRWHDYLRHPLARAKYRYFKNRVACSLYRVLGMEMPSFRRQLDVEHAKGFLFSYPRAMAELSK